MGHLGPDEWFSRAVVGSDAVNSAHFCCNQPGRAQLLLHYYHCRWRTMSAPPPPPAYVCGRMTRLWILVWGKFRPWWCCLAPVLLTPAHIILTPPQIVMLHLLMKTLHLIVRPRPNTIGVTPSCQNMPWLWCSTPTVLTLPLIVMLCPYTSNAGPYCDAPPLHC